LRGGDGVLLVQIPKDAQITLEGCDQEVPIVPMSVTGNILLRAPIKPVLINRDMTRKAV
jgi:hypothetical protein